MSTQLWALSHLQSYKFSFRRTDDAVIRIVESIRVYGLRILLLVMRAGEILDQQFHAKVARLLGFTQLPVPGTPKPVERSRRSILNHTEPGKLVYDPFLGYGTILIAAQQTARVCYGLAMDSAYVDAIILRWEKPSRGSGAGSRWATRLRTMETSQTVATEQAVNSGAA